MLCRNGKFQLSCLINSETILHGIKQKRKYIVTLYRMMTRLQQQLIQQFVHPSIVLLHSVTRYLYFVCAFIWPCFQSFLFLASHIHEHKVQVVQLQQKVLTVIHLMISVAVLFLTLILSHPTPHSSLMWNFWRWNHEERLLSPNSNTLQQTTALNNKRIMLFVPSVYLYLLFMFCFMCHPWICAVQQDTTFRKWKCVSC
jgi:hypothetical protein